MDEAKLRDYIALIDRTKDKNNHWARADLRVTFGIPDEYHDEIIKRVDYVRDYNEKNLLKNILTSKTARAKAFFQAQPYFFDKSKLWWLWNHKEFCWNLVDEIDVLNMIQDNNEIDVINQKNRAEILNSLKQEGRRRIPQELNPRWIQFKNKIINIDTLDEFEASPDFFVTNPIPWNLGEVPDTPTIDRIFTEWVGEEQKEILYEILAYCMLPDMPIHRIFCFIGEGMNGKSKYLELLRKFIGPKNCCATELDTLLNSRFEVTRLHKKLVCQMGETNFNEMSKTSLLKKLSGGDLIGFEYKNKNPFEENNYAKIIIATNNLPSTTDKTIGFYRRWTIIDFPNSFTEKKDILSEIPEEEYSNLALRCFITLKDVLKKREFHNEGSIEDRIDKYESKSNFLEKFISLFVKDDPESFITKADFMRKFNDWCKENRHRQLSDKTLGSSMRKLGYDSGKKTLDFMREGKAVRAMSWLGIKWREDG